MATINGRVSDKSTGKAIQGATVTLGGITSRTDSFGAFSINFTGDNPPSTIRVIAPKYAPKKESAINQDGSLKQKVNVIELKPLIPEFGVTLPAIIVFGRIQLRSLKDRFGGGPESKLVEGLLSETSKLYQRLIPFALKQLSRFGIDDPADLENKSCPGISEINTAITEKNKTTRQLNNSYNSIKSVGKQTGILEAIITAFQLVRKLLGANPTPTALGLPPSPAGGIFPPPLTKTIGQTTSYDSKREKIDKLLDRFKNLTTVLPDSTVPLSIALSEAVDLLNATDQAVGDCLNGIRQGVIDELNKKQQGDITGALSGSDAGNVGIGVGSNGENISGGGLNVADARAAGINTVDNFDFSTVSENDLRNILGLPSDSDINVQDLLAGNYLQVALDSELTALTDQAATDGQPSVTEYNGFILSVETESEEAAQGKSIKRRFAVAKNKDGVVLLQGEKSYSSNDQILIDELIFKIESEDLTSA